MTKCSWLAWWLVGALLPQAAEAAKKPKPGAAGATIRVSPRSALYMIGRPIGIYIHVSIPVPTEDFFCPKVELTIYGGVPSGDADCPMMGTCFGAAQVSSKNYPAIRKGWEGDCPPWNGGIELRGFHHLADGTIVDDYAPREAWSWSLNSLTQRWGLGPGDWQVDVRLSQGTKVRLLSAHVLVHGGN